MQARTINIRRKLTQTQGAFRQTIAAGDIAPQQDLGFTESPASDNSH
jgi:hypothetical protein